jgi:sigma-B regulation protein RsbU (phosphoserine phosphatase)
MPTFSETDEVRAEVQEQLRYNQARGVTLFGFWLLVFVLRVLWRLPVATEILLGLGAWLGANLLYAVGLRRCASMSDIHTLALGYLILELLLLTFCVHFLGGVEWIGVLFYGLIVGDASQVLPTRRIYLVVTLAVFLFGSLAFAEYSGLILHRPFFLPGLTLHQDLTWVTLTVLSAAGALAYMAYVFSRLTSALRQRKEALRAAYEQKTRELELARSVQARFLKEPPVIPGLDIAAVNLPAAEVSGDFYDFLPAGDGRHVLVVGDVAGHGIPAALTMSATMMAMELSLQSFNENGDRPAAGEVLGQLARGVDGFLTRRIGGESFVTAFFALYDEREKSVVTLDLGHAHVLAYVASLGKAVPPRWAGERYLPLMASRYVPSGLANGKDPQPWPLRVEPGDALVLYTDGLVEARNGKEAYGVKRLRWEVAQLGSLSAREIAQGIMGSVKTFTKGEAQKDDVTLVVVKRTAEKNQIDDEERS